MENSESSVSLKLLVDAKSNKVLFAEAGKDFVDFLFSLLSLPVGTVIRLLSKNGMVGSFGKLYESVENMNETYLQPNFSKDTLLKPRATVAGPNILQLTNNNKKTTSPSSALPNFAFGPSNLSAFGQPNLSPFDQSKKTGASSSSSAAGYVKDVVTYMIMDDLEVKPMSTISSITLFNRFNIKDVGFLDEKVVELGMEEGVKLLKESLRSKSVLTNVFLGKKSAP